MLSELSSRLLTSVCALAVGLFLGISEGKAAQDHTNPPIQLVQIPYEPPPQPKYSPSEDPTPPPETLSPQDQERLESLVPLLDGRQELWAMGEFVHFGKHSVPFVIKGLTMPGARVRFNSIETLAMLKDPSAVPALLEVATNTEEESRIRTHALRVATKLDATKVVPAIEVMAKDPNSTIRNTAVFQARYVKLKEVLPIIISVIPDPEQYVSITARDSFWLLTRFSGSIHDWEISTQEQREEWAKEWWTWLEERKGQIQNAPSKKTVPTPPAALDVS